ncbi:hypothetical protein ABZ807_30695, partial [Micromonospora sp. NPDC047548]|uniref:hypothetical protein n=1 Tax=Micromonospora sp. NPDC047548 TaxID=3155624 RepID=UPI0033E6CC9F
EHSEKEPFNLRRNGNNARQATSDRPSKRAAPFGYMWRDEVVFADQRRMRHVAGDHLRLQRVPAAYLRLTEKIVGGVERAGSVCCRPRRDCKSAVGGTIGSCPLTRYAT